MEKVLVDVAGNSANEKDSREEAGDEDEVLQGIGAFAVFKDLAEDVLDKKRNPETAREAGHEAGTDSDEKEAAMVAGDGKIAGILHAVEGKYVAKEPSDKPSFAPPSGGIDILEALSASLEAPMEPEILFRGLADKFLNKAVDFERVGLGILGGDAGHFREDLNPVASVGQTIAAEREDRCFAHAGEAAGGGVGDRRDPEKRDQGAVLDPSALIGSVPDKLPFPEGPDEVFHFIKMDHAAHQAGAAFGHDAGNLGLVGLPVKAAEGMVVEEDATGQLEGRHVGGEEKGSPTGGRDRLEVLEAGYFRDRPDGFRGFPPAGGHFEDSHAEGLVMTKKKPTAFLLGHFREAEAEINEANLSAVGKYEGHEGADAFTEAAGQSEGKMGAELEKEDTD